MHSMPNEVFKCVFKLRPCVSHIKETRYENRLFVTFFLMWGGEMC